MESTDWAGTLAEAQKQTKNRGRIDREEGFVFTLRPPPSWRVPAWFLVAMEVAWLEKWTGSP